MIRVGSDADFAIVDLNETYRIDGEKQLSASAYSPWDGWEMTGRVRHTYVRGNRVYSVGEEFAAPTGRYISRAHSGMAALEAAR